VGPLFRQNRLDPGERPSRHLARNLCGAAPVDPTQRGERIIEGGRDSFARCGDEGFIAAARSERTGDDRSSARRNRISLTLAWGRNRRWHAVKPGQRGASSEG
jgi:hypothetical protein